MKIRADLTDRQTLLGSARPGHALTGPGEIDFNDAAVLWLWRIGIAKQMIAAAILGNQFDMARITRRRVQIIERAVVHREETAGGAIFGGHVGDRGPFLQEQR